jgi:hypothetical protein
MRVNFVRVICAVVLALTGINTAVAQEGYHQLTVNDFRGVPRPNDGSVAYTQCSIDFNYRVRGENNNYRLTFNVKLVLDRNNSWLDNRRALSPQMLAEILKHEQGHYTIAYMEQQEVLREAARTHFTANYQAEANTLFNRIHTKYERLNSNYDDDTQHMCNRNQQHSWDVYFKKRLTFMPPINT